MQAIFNGGQALAPSPALLNTVYLWGAHLSTSTQLQQRVPFFLDRAIQSMVTALSGSHPLRALHVLQAEVLLAHYCYSEGRLVEGRHHASAAAALVLSSGLHERPGSRRLPPRALGHHHHALSPPQDAVEEKERIDAFWAVWTLDRSWSLLTDMPSILNTDSIEIALPVPYDIHGSQVSVYQQ